MMPAFYDHANSIDWWDGPDRFKKINRCEVASVQNEQLILLLDLLVPGKKLDIGGPTPPHIKSSETPGHTGNLVNFTTCNIVPGRAQVTCDACALPFESESFSLVFSSHTIEHVHDANKFIVECDRVLMPGGFLYIICPDRNLDPHNDTANQDLGGRSYEEFTPKELMDRISTLLPTYRNVLSFNTRHNNYDFDIFLRKPAIKK